MVFVSLIRSLLWSSITMQLSRSTVAGRHRSLLASLKQVHCDHAMTSHSLPSRHRSHILSLHFLCLRCSSLFKHHLSELLILASVYPLAFSRGNDCLNLNLGGAKWHRKINCQGGELVEVLIIFLRLELKIQGLFHQLLESGQKIYINRFAFSGLH
jgi:hypothetical protein